MAIEDNRSGDWGLGRGLRAEAKPSSLMTRLAPDGAEDGAVSESQQGSRRHLTTL